MERLSASHDLVVTEEDNGELQEDVVAKAVIDDTWLDAELSESFPASDPPSHWAGPSRRSIDARRTMSRVVHRWPVDEVPERTDPSAPMPRNLPRA